MRPGSLHKYTLGLTQAFEVLGTLLIEEEGGTGRDGDKTLLQTCTQHITGFSHSQHFSKDGIFMLLD